MLKIIIDSHGSRSCQKWIEGLQKTDPKVYRKLKYELEFLELFGGKMLKGGHKPSTIKPLIDGIWQIRIDDYRVLYFYQNGDTIVITNGFTKKRNSTPSSEIEKAILIKKKLMSK